MEEINVTLSYLHSKDTTSSKPGVFYTHSAQFIWQVLNGHVWLATTILD